MRSFLVLSGLMVLASCAERPRQSDLIEVGDHYRFRHHGQCDSWIMSFRTGFEYCASPVIEVPAYKDPMHGVPEPDGPVTQAALMERGERVYGKICVACHQADGKGQAGTYPPLAGASEFYGTEANMAGIVLNGLSGKITVLGQPYDGAMPGQAQLTDYEVAAVTTFVRNSFGNPGGMVTPDIVKSQRK